MLSLTINLGMWFERFVIVVPSLSHEFEPWRWSTYAPTWVDYSILLGSFGWFFMWFLLFIKQLPVLAISELKEVLPPKMRHPHVTTSQRAEHGGMANPLMNQPPLGGSH
jgi:molybdopterin-containing oxidoreductase family membrane subunit